MKRFYAPYTEWEDFKAGMWRTIPKQPTTLRENLAGHIFLLKEKLVAFVKNR